jgi:hypothetical protein
MASRPKSKKKPAPKSAKKADKAPGIDKKTLTALAAVYDQTSRRSAEASGALGNAIQAAEKKGLNPAAFRTAMQFRRKGLADPIKLRSFLDDLSNYMKILQVGKLVAADLFKDEKPAKPSSKKKDTSRDLTEAAIAAVEADQSNVERLDDHREEEVA